MDQKYWHALNKCLPKEANYLFRGCQRSLGWVVLRFFTVVPCLLPAWIVFYRHCRIEKGYKAAWTGPSHHYQLLPPSLLLLLRETYNTSGEGAVCSQVLQHFQDVWSPFLPQWSFSSQPVARLVLSKMLLLSWERTTYPLTNLQQNPTARLSESPSLSKSLQRPSGIFCFAIITP